MATKKRNRELMDGVLFQERMYRHYLNKYYQLFLASLHFEGLDYQQEYFLKKKLWSVGAVIVFKKLNDDGIPSIEEYLGTEYETIPKGDNLYITEFARNGIDIYNFPLSVTPVAPRGQNLFPVKLKVGEEAVVIWANDTHNSILFQIDPILQELVEVEVALRMNRFVQRVPRMVTTTPEDKDRVANFMNKVIDGEPVVFIQSDMWQSIKNVIEAGGNYVIDKLYMYKSQLEGEIKTILGIPNNTTEKKERLITSEIDANDIEFATYRGSIINTLKSCFDEVRKVLGVNIQVVDTLREEELEDIKNKQMENGVQKGDGENETTNVQSNQNSN